MRRRRKIIKCCIFVVLFWCLMWVFDYIRVSGEKVAQKLDV